MRKIDLKRWGIFFEALNAGKTVEQACRASRISKSVGYKFVRMDPRSTGLEAASLLGVSMVAGNLVEQPLSEEAYKALEDFAFFRRRYFGRESTPWQVRAAYDCLRAIESDDREFVVINCPPGSGKSTLFTCDIIAWLIARDRSIRIQIGSRTERQARMYVSRVKRALEREAPLRADADSLAKGIAFDADACLFDDFGPFKPDGRSDLWAQNALVVRQQDQTMIDDKEPTLSAWGQDSGFLGGRFDFIVWDDLVDSRNTRTEEARDKLVDWWTTEAECQPEWALVDYADGVQRTAGEVKVGDVLVGLDGPTTVTGVKGQPDAQVFRLTTDLGRELHVTGNHPVWTPDGFVEARDMLNRHVLPPTVDTYGDLSPEDAAILGYLVGDGGTSKANGTVRAGFTNADPGVLDRFTVLSEKKGWTVRRKPGSGRAWQLDLSGGVRDFIRHHRIDCRAEDKTIPDEVMSASKKAQLAFIGAYFDCDGTVYGMERKSPQVRWASTSLTLLRQLVTLCGRHGMRLRVGTANTKGGVYRPCWTAALDSPSNARFAHTIPVADSLKAGRLAEIRLRNMLPFPAQQADRVVSVEPLGVMPVIGIETDSGTYATGDVVTHNTRLEPQGALILQGQRIHRNDLYRYALEQSTLEDEKKYRHIVYRAHDDESCTEEHGKDAQPWPKGCLLDPHRIPWRILENAKRNNPRVFDVQYQQNDGDYAGGLVDSAWLYGGIDAEGYPAPGCFDKERRRGEIPPHLRDSAWSFVTVDPSPTEWWGVIWWVYDPATQNRYIVEVHRERLNPEQFLSLDLLTFEFSGLMVGLHERSVKAGHPIRDVIVEVNAAQKWLLQQPHVQHWMDATGVRFIPHTTSSNKSDPKFGVESIGDYFRQGRVRIPYSDIVARKSADPLVTELLAYPDGDTDDLVMSCWFMTLGVNNYWAPRQKRMYRASRPAWLSSQRGLSYA